MKVVGVTLAAALLLVSGAHWLTRDLVMAIFMTMIFVTLASNYDVLGGRLGFLNLGQGMFFGLAAYVTVLFVNAPSIPLAGPLKSFAGALLALVIVAGFSFAVATPMFRLRGAYFAVATLALVLIARSLVLNLPSLTGGPTGLYLPAPYYLDLKLAYYLAAALAGISIAMNVWISRNRLGIAFDAIRENERTAQAIGIDVLRYKRVGLVLSSLPTALAGSVYALQSGYIDVDSVLGIEKTTLPVIMAMLGGSGWVAGPLVGAVVLQAIDVIVLNFLALPIPAHGLYGVIFIVVGLLMPQGLLPKIFGRNKAANR
jgi:branched-chain amino acid transport system permease protein